MSEKRRIENKRVRRSGNQKGKLSIPEGVLPKDRHHRFEFFTGESLSRLKTLGYEPVRLSDPAYKDLLANLGDGTAAEASNREGDFVTIASGKDKLILVECPIELYEQGQREKAAKAKEYEGLYKTPEDGLASPRIIETIDTKSK